MHRKKPKKNISSSSYNNDAYQKAQDLEAEKQRAYFELEIKLAQTHDIYERLKLIEEFDNKYYSKKDNGNVENVAANDSAANDKQNGQHNTYTLEQAVKDYINGNITHEELTQKIIEIQFKQHDEQLDEEPVNNLFYPEGPANITDRINKIYDDYEIAIAEIKASNDFSAEDKKQMYADLEMILRQLELATHAPQISHPEENEILEHLLPSQKDVKHFSSPQLVAIINIHQLNKKLKALLLSLTQPKKSKKVTQSIDDFPTTLDDVIDQIDEIEEEFTNLIAQTNAHLDQNIKKLVREFVVSAATIDNRKKIAEIEKTEKLQDYLFNKMIRVNLNLMAEAKLHSLFDPRNYIMRQSKAKKKRALRVALNELFEEYTDYFSERRYRRPTHVQKGLLNRIKRFKMNRLIAREFWRYILRGSTLKSHNSSEQLRSTLLDKS